ncbi:hypothetical protein E2C01_024617 [Portunus trituberculatus]|uniref:Uncharacterized protein n=1 Tax=Portunus trituberculatus TaxID=210409 RepID=A0A5B7EB43_PORTR|nr:hypothetical protein [Portunus trituberculatus]
MVPPQIPPIGRGKTPESPPFWDILRKDWRNRIRYRYEIALAGERRWEAISPPWVSAGISRREEVEGRLTSLNVSRCWQERRWEAICPPWMSTGTGMREVGSNLSSLDDSRHWDECGGEKQSLLPPWMTAGIGMRDEVGSSLSSLPG